MNGILFFGLMLLVALSPLPLGSNREWAWSLCAVLIGALSCLWILAAPYRKGQGIGLPPRASVALLAVACVWACLQAAPWAPDEWWHPLWVMASDALGVGGPGYISMAPVDTWTSLMRLLSYVLAFVLAAQLGRDPQRARMAFGWLAIAGFAYSVFGLYVYWSGYHPEWLFGDRTLAHDVRSSFINRNHFATWVGLAALCAIAHLYQFLSVPVVKPYSVPKDRPAQIEEFILRAWKPMIGLFLMVTALILTHSRGGFVSTLAGCMVLLMLLDRRGASRRTLSRVTVLAAIVVASISFYLTSEVLLDRINRTDLTSEERLAVFANVERGIADNPVLGFGYGTFTDSFRLYDDNETPFHYDRAHNTWLENAFELGVPAALGLYAALGIVTLACLRGVRYRHRNWVYPATGVAASVLVGLHATVDFSLQLPAVAILYAVIMGIAFAQSYSPAREQE